MTHLKYIQLLPISVEHAWDFFSNPMNLNKITPPDMNFQIINPLPERVYPGLFIEYRVSPLAGIPLEWITEITQVQESRYFIDEQRKGPYRIWHHEHHFRAIEGGVEMTDKLSYAVPFGLLGKGLNQLFIRKKVESIFSYRRKILDQHFGIYPPEWNK